MGFPPGSPPSHAVLVCFRSSSRADLYVEVGHAYHIPTVADVERVGTHIETLSLIRDSARSDLATACCQFGLHPDQLRTITALSPTDLMQIVASTGNVLLFAPRDDIDLLLAPPRTVIPILAGARSHGPARAPAATS